MGTATGPANLEADWTANTINLEWYNEDTKLTVPTTSNTCTYDGGITLPSTNPTKTGYTFRGWQVRANSVCNDVSCFDLSLNSSVYGYRYRQSLDSETCTGYPLSGCSENFYNDVSLNEWKVEFEYGTVKGTAMLASNKNNRQYAEGTPSESGGKCWCKITQINGKEESSLPWIYYSDYSYINSIYSRQFLCASGCSHMNSYPFFRASLYGLAHNVTDCSALTDANSCLSAFNTSYNDTCFWQNSTCYNMVVSDCSLITNEAVCGNSRESRYAICYWEDGTCNASDGPI